MSKKTLTYRDKFVEMDREAQATFVCALLITLIFWMAICCFGDSDLTVLSLPLWFVLSCIGGYILSIVGVLVLIKVYFVNFDLNKDDEEEEDSFNVK